VNALTVNPQTGFLESVAPNFESFDSQRKQALLQLANECADRDEAPNLNEICKRIGINLRTFHRHLQVDEVFREAWDEVRLKIEDALQRSLVRQGVKGSQGITAAIFWLKNRVSERWNDGQPHISLDLSGLKQLTPVNNGFIDVEATLTNVNKDNSTVDVNKCNELTNINNNNHVNKINNASPDAKPPPPPPHVSD
jgi:hypothetical protein